MQHCSSNWQPDPLYISSMAVSKRRDHHYGKSHNGDLSALCLSGGGMNVIKVLGGEREDLLHIAIVMITAVRASPPIDVLGLPPPSPWHAKEVQPFNIAVRNCWVALKKHVHESCYLLNDGTASHFVVKQFPRPLPMHGIVSYCTSA